MAVWPAAFCPAINSLSEAAPKNTIRTQMDKGPPKVRRRTTANTWPHSFTLFLSDAELEQLKTFFNDTTFSGSEQFDYTHPVTGEALQARFMSEPSWRDRSGVMWTVDIDLEILP